MARYWIKVIPSPPEKPLILNGIVASVGLIAPEHMLTESAADFSLWLPCDGQFLSSHKYPLLFAEIGFLFGMAGSHHFRLPFLNLPFKKE